MKPFTFSKLFKFLKMKGHFKKNLILKMKAHYENMTLLAIKLQNPSLIIFNHVFFSFTEHHQQHQNLLKAEEDLHFCDLLQSLLTLKFLPWKILAKRSRTSKITMHQLMTLTRINPKVRNVFYYQLKDHYLKSKSSNFDNRKMKKKNPYLKSLNS